MYIPYFVYVLIVDLHGSNVVGMERCQEEERFIDVILCQVRDNFPVRGFAFNPEVKSRRLKLLSTKLKLEPNTQVVSTLLSIATVI